LVEVEVVFVVVVEVLVEVEETFLADDVFEVVVGEDASLKL
jgi:hypothetical protein